MFIVPRDDTWTSKGSFGDGPWTYVIGDIDRFKKMDKGGAIYALDSETFETDPDRNMHGIEWTSTVPVKPVNQEIYKTGLEAMIDNGVRVVVTSPEDFEIFKRLKDQQKYEEAYEFIARQKQITRENLSEYQDHPN